MVRRLALIALVLIVGVPLVLAALFRVLPPPLTPLMVIRLLEGEGLRKGWVALSEVSPHVAPAVIAAEDNRFCQHHGFDWTAITEAVEDYQAGKRLRGASTITMQTAKNLFLWPGRSYLRKGLEAYLASMLEVLWSKRRILEVYLNIAEWGPGVYGIDAGARHHFGKPAEALSRRQAALLASILPAPRRRSAAAPSAGVSRKASAVLRRIGQIRPLLDCI